MALPQPEHVVVAGGEVAEIEGHVREPVGPGDPPRLDEPLRDPALVEHLEGPGGRPPARDPSTSWPARRSTMTLLTPASASSPASISPVGPPPTITTACSVISHLHVPWVAA